MGAHTAPQNELNGILSQTKALEQALEHPPQPSCPPLPTIAAGGSTAAQRANNYIEELSLGPGVERTLRVRYCAASPAPASSGAAGPDDDDDEAVLTTATAGGSNKAPASSSSGE